MDAFIYLVGMTKASKEAHKRLEKEVIEEVNRFVKSGDFSDIEGRLILEYVKEEKLK